MGAVTERLRRIAAQSRKLGLFLHIPPNILDEIGGNNISQCLEEVVTEFLTNGKNPTWRKVVKAVRPLHGALAKKIANDHKGIVIITCYYNKSLLF